MQKAKKKKAIGYLRVSTHGQVDKFGFDVQRKMILEYAEKNGYEIVYWFEESFTGSSENRPEMTKIFAGEFDADYIIVAKADRFARDIQYYYALKYKLQHDKGIELVSVSEDFGQMGTFKPVIEAFIASFAEIERTYINQRTSGGREVKRKLGGYCGGLPPYGYEVLDGKLVIIPEQAKVVRTIFEMRNSGMPFRQMCSELNNQGYTNRRGGKFSPSTISTILDNENTYKGLYRYGKDSEWVQGQQEPILSPINRW
jgi:DNA invertase Pin-like site-specific DNA recombinase